MTHRAHVCGAERRLLIVDDSEHRSWALMRAFESRGYAVKAANSVPQARRLIEGWHPDCAVLDLRLPGPSGLTLIQYLKTVCGARVVMLTGYASIATAVEAIKLGATHYLTKPVDASTIEAAFAHDSGNPGAAPTAKPLSMERMEWEYIQRVLVEQRGNVSAAARVLGMYRKTLQRRLTKCPHPD